MKVTITAIKADVGSVGGHTMPSTDMLVLAAERLKLAENDGLIISGNATHTGDDICLLMTHGHGSGAAEIHRFAWQTLKDAANLAGKTGMYGAGQDLLVDAPSGNVRGAGPGSAEVTFELGTSERAAESFLVFMADKCGPGAFNLPLWLAFTNPMFCMGLMLPGMREGFRFRIIDMEHAGGDHVLYMDAPEEHVDMAVLLRDENRFGIQGIWSRKYPNQQVVAVSTDRLHTIAGKYVGKDDPVAIVRSQSIFPAPEELVSPFLIAPYVAGDARGSHHMPWMPVPVNTAVTGPYCLPIIACAAHSLSPEGRLSERVDVFGNPVWDETRRKAQIKGEMMRQQGWFGAAMLPTGELEYSKLRDVLAELCARFEVQS